jgi:hypothetical protein
MTVASGIGASVREQDDDCIIKDLSCFNVARTCKRCYLFIKRDSGGAVILP